MHIDVQDAQPGGGCPALGRFEAPLLREDQLLMAVGFGRERDRERRESERERRTSHESFHIHALIH